MKSLVVIGAGVGGLTAALRLAARGYDVQIVEKNEQVGGKLNQWESAGYTFDTGPTLLTMPFVLRELFASVGAVLEDHLTLERLDPVCRYSFADGSGLDVRADLDLTNREIARLSPDDAGGLDRFLTHARRVYQAAAGPFLLTPFSSLRGIRLLAAARFLPSVLHIDAFRTLDACVSEYFKDPRLRQLFNRFATYNGSSPYRAPATLSIIPYVELVMGGWYIRGGMYRLVSVLEKLARQHGARIRTGQAVAGIVQHRRHVVGVRLETGEEIAADAVICNADALYATRNLLGHESEARYGRVEPSLAGFVLLLGVRRTFPGLAHHNIFFTSDYRAEFDALFGAGSLPDDPTVYVANSSATDPSMAPAGSSNLFVLVNAPPLRKGMDWSAIRSSYREVVLRKLRSYGVDIRDEEVDTETIVTPDEFERRYNAYRGSIYGTSSNGRMAAFLRPPNRARFLEGLYFVGGSAHPGGGVPLVMLSGRIVADLVEQRK